MTQQAALGGGCCCSTDLEGCGCAQVDASPESLTVSVPASIFVEGSDSCGALLFGSGTLTQISVPRVFYQPQLGQFTYQTPDLPFCQTPSPSLGTVSCTNMLCKAPRDCNPVPACDPPVIVQHVTSELPWFQNGTATTTRIDTACAGVTYSYGEYCEWQAQAFNTTYQTAAPGTFHFSARVSLRPVFGDVCVMRADVTLFGAGACPTTPLVWNNPLIGTNFVVSSTFTKRCRFPGDSVRGTYRAEAPINDTYSASGQVGSRTYSYTVAKFMGQVLTVT